MSNKPKHRHLVVTKTSDIQTTMINLRDAGITSTVNWLEDQEAWHACVHTSGSSEYGTYVRAFSKESPSHALHVAVSEYYSQPEQCDHDHN